MGVYSSKTKLKRQKGSRERLAVSISDKMDKIKGLREKICKSFNVKEKEELDKLEFRLSKNLNEYISVDIKIQKYQSKLG